jgi:hypothetical protein
MAGLMANEIQFRLQADSFKELAAEGVLLINALNDHLKASDGVIDHFKVEKKHPPHSLRVSFYGQDILFRVELEATPLKAFIRAYILSTQEPKEIKAGECQFRPYQPLEKNDKNEVTIVAINGENALDQTTRDKFAANVLNAVAAALADKEKKLVLKLQ